MVSGMEKFGEFVRRERKAKEIGLREMAKMIGVSPTYLSKIERDEFPPPAEDKVRKIATIIGCDADDVQIWFLIKMHMNQRMPKFEIIHHQYAH